MPMPEFRWSWIKLVRVLALLCLSALVVIAFLMLAAGSALLLAAQRLTGGRLLRSPDPSPFGALERAI